MNRNTIFNALLFCIVFVAIERFCHRQTHGFSMRKIRSDLTFNTKWESSHPSRPELQEIRDHLSQPYSFLNSGGESYVFVSKDGDYVLKFFKQHHMRPNHWTDSFLPKSIQNRRTKRLNTLFSSCKLAYNRFREETGLVYLHLNKTDNLNVELQLFDPIGVVHKLPLDQFEFALQKRASMAYPTLSALANAREFDAAKVRLSSLVSLMARRCQVGLADHDARKRNFGFIGGQAVEIDLGSFSLNESLKTPQKTSRAFLLETMKLRRWIKKYHPELSGFLDEQIQQTLRNND